MIPIFIKIFDLQFQKCDMNKFGFIPVSHYSNNCENKAKSYIKIDDHCYFVCKYCLYIINNSHYNFSKSSKQEYTKFKKICLLK